MKRTDDSRGQLAVALAFIAAGLLALGLDATYTALICATIATLVGLTA